MKMALLRVVLFAGFCTALSARAQTNSWTSTAQPGGFWDESFNWSLGTPSVNHSANLITNAPTKNVVIDECVLQFSPGSTTISNLTLSAPIGSVNTLSMTNTPDTGCTGIPELTVVNDLAIQSGGVISVDTNATLRVQGLSGGAFTIDGEVQLGKSGAIVASNVTTWVGRVSGALTVSGGQALFRDLVVSTNAAGVGTLSVAGGTLVASNIQVASSLNSTGFVWVTGGGQFAVTNGQLSVGSAGAGQMTISNGTVTTGPLSLGVNAGAGGTLSLAGGTLTVSHGATPFSVVFAAGGSSGATGAVWMTGGHLVVNNQSVTSSVLVVGFAGGVGTMAVSNGLVEVENLSVSDAVGTGLGTFTMAGGTLVASGTFSAGNASGNRGYVWISGGQLAATNLVVGNFGDAQMAVSNGTIQVSNEIIGARSTGALTVAGGTNIVSSALTLGSFDCTATGSVAVTSGGLFVTNAAGNATLEVRSGTLALGGGTLVVDRLVATNSCGHFFITGGTLVALTALLNPADDADGDGLPNGWESQYGLDQFSAAGDSGATGDPDGDGMSNLQEFLAGTDPTNSASSFRITSVVATASDILVTWMMGSGKTNALQWTTGAVDGSYQTNGFADLFNVTNTVGTVTNYLDVGGATNVPASYYRVRLVP